MEPYALADLPGGHPRGTGLNLHVARLLARHMGGDLTCAAGPSAAGTVYALTVPATVHSRSSGSIAGGVVVPFHDHYARHRAQLTPRHILIAEDQVSNQHVIASTLQRGGHSVVIAEDGDQALDHIGSGKHFDAVVVDIGLPSTNGIDVMKLSRFRQPGSRELPFIVLTGQTSEKVRQECFAAGAWTFLPKPVSAQRLLDAVLFVCDRAERLKATEPITQNVIQLGALNSTVGTALASGASSPAVFDNLRDLLRYASEIEAAASAGQWSKVVHRVRATRGAAVLLGASCVVAVCRRIVETPPAELPTLWPAMQRDLGESVQDAWQTLSTLLTPQSAPQ